MVVLRSTGAGLDLHYGEHQLMEVKRTLLVGPEVAGEDVAEICGFVQNLNDNDGKMSDGTLLIVMLSKLKSAEIAIIETIRRKK